MKIYHLITLLFFIWSPFPAQAQDTTGYMVVVGEVTTQKQGAKLMKDASLKTDFAVQIDTVTKTPKLPDYLGLVLLLHGPNSAGKYVVSAYVGKDKKDAQTTMNLFRPHFPKVALKTIDSKYMEKAVSYSANVYSYVVILGSFSEYKDALKRVRELAQKTGQVYDSRGLIYDAKKGLVWPEGDDPWAGSYFARRYDSCFLKNHDGPCLTIERSDAYRGFEPGYYIIVAGLEGDSKAAKARANSFKSHVADAYAKQTVIYMGCMN